MELRGGIFRCCVGLFVSLVLICNVQTQNAVPSTPAGKARNGKGCIYVETSLSGSIVSPGYPVEYPPSAACKWTINSPPGTVVKLFFNDFYIEATPDCKSDYLLLFDGPNATSKKVGRYCNIRPERFTSTSNSVHLEFYSDSSLSYRGFHAYYNTTPATTIKPTLPWKVLPMFVQALSNITVIEGNLVKLVCDVRGTPAPRIIWKKDLQNVTKNDRFVVDDNLSKSILTINDATTSDSGMYSCIAFNDFGPGIKSDAWVTVKVRDLPIIKKTTENKTVTVGSKVRLKCKANGPAPISIRWIKEGKKLAGQKCDTSHDCKIESTQEISENSRFTCEARNKAGHVTRNVAIKVKGPPIFLIVPQSQRKPAGLSVNFSCKAVGNPPVTISWMKDNQTVSDGVVTAGDQSVLQFTVKKDTTVTCSAKDQDGITSKQAKLTVTDSKDLPRWVALKFVEIPNNLNLEYKSTARLTCRAKGFPKPELSWLKDDVIITSGVDNSNGVSTLTLKSIEKAINISCIAKNSHGEIKSTAMLKVISDPNENIQPIDKEPDAINNDMKLILGAVGGLLLLTIIIIIILVLRRRKNKKTARDAAKADPPVENENLINNPLFNSERDESETVEGIEALHYPRENIVHCEDIDDKDDCIKIFIGSATDLPFTTGEQKVLVKLLKDDEPSREKRKQFTTEATLLASFDHSNVVQLMAVCIKTTPLSFIFEYSEYGYLDEYLQDCDPSELPRICRRKTEFVRDSYTELGNVDRLSIAKQVAAGMQYLTEKGYTHQELRSRNCMVFKNLQVKVANLGLRWVKPEQNFFAMEPADKKKYPVRWLSPEVILYGEQESSEPADIWSYGVVVWEIFSDGMLPYTGISDNDVVSYVRGCNVLPRPKACPQDIYEVLKTCWEITPTDRPNFASLFETMSALHAGVRV